MVCKHIASAGARGIVCPNPILAIHVFGLGMMMDMIAALRTPIISMRRNGTERNGTDLCSGRRVSVLEGWGKGGVAISIELYTGVGISFWKYIYVCVCDISTLGERGGGVGREGKGRGTERPEWHGCSFRRLLRGVGSEGLLPWDVNESTFGNLGKVCGAVRCGALLPWRFLPWLFGLCVTQ